MLGRELALLFEARGLAYIGTGREVDVCSRETLFSFAEKQQDPIKWIINCAAYTAVDKAEDDRENCFLLNAEAAGNISRAADKIGAQLLHISTDYVFNGQGNRPYTEEDPVEPIGVYGLSKREGEIKVLEGNVNSYIIRTAWLYGKYGNNFVLTMLRLIKERERVSVVKDQRGSPTWTWDLAETIIKLLNLSNAGYTIPYGIYHFSNEGEISWFDFAREIYAQGRIMGLLARDCEITPCSSADYPARVKRPAYSALDKAKIKAALGITIRAWDESLREFFKTCVN